MWWSTAFSAWRATPEMVRNLVTRTKAGPAVLKLEWAPPPEG